MLCLLGVPKGKGSIKSVTFHAAEIAEVAAAGCSRISRSAVRVLGRVINTASVHRTPRGGQGQDVGYVPWHFDRQRGGLRVESKRKKQTLLGDFRV